MSDYPLRRLITNVGPPTEGDKAFDEALKKLNEDVKKADIPADTSTTKYCRCACHYSPGVMHFTSCCNGKCSKCGFYIKVDLEKHEKMCGEKI